MLLIIRHLFLTSALGLDYCAFHRRGNGIGIHDNLAVCVSCRAPYRLYKRCFGAQEALLVGVEDYDKRDLGNIKTLTQQVYADEHIKFSETQVAYYLHALYRVNIVVHIADFYAEIFKIIRQILGHLFSQSCEQYTLFALHSDIYFGYYVVYLTLGGSDGD